MSKSSSNEKESDLDLDTSVTHVGNEDENQASTEEEIQRLTNEQNCAGYDDLKDSRVVGEEMQIGSIGDSTLTEEQIMPSDNDGYGSAIVTDRLPLKTHHDSRYSQEEAKIGFDVTRDNDVKVNDVAMTANDSDSQNPNESKGGMSTSGHSILCSIDVSCSNKGDETNELPRFEPSTETVMEALGSEDDDPPPLPVCQLSHMFQDGPKSKQNQLVKELGGTGSSVSFGTGFADAANTEKMSASEAAEQVEGIQSPSSILQPSPPRTAAEVDYQTQGQDFKRMVGQEPCERPGLPSSQIIQGALNHPDSYSTLLYPTVSNDHQQETKEEDNDILIPEAVPVANEIIEDPSVRVAQLVQPDNSIMSLKKHHALVILVMVAVIVVTLVLALNFTKRNVPPIELLEDSPTSQLPSSIPQSLQRSQSIRYEIESNVLQRNATFDDMEAIDSRLLALDWITEKDQMKLNATDSNLFQRYTLALLALDFSYDGWLSDSNECNWIGVECDTYGQVIALELIRKGLDGTMPPEISKLQYLQMLSLSDNYLAGTLPSEICDMKYLSEVYLNRNNLTSTLPFGIGNLEELIALKLGYNDFTGPLPSELGNLKKLTHLYLDYNLFSGSLPSELFNLKDLNVLTLSGNEFTGTLPSIIRNLNKLAELRLDRNQFTGTFPSEVGSMSNLTHIILWFNQFSGAIPTELGNLSRLHELDFDSNDFTGTLPSEIANAPNLARLYLYSNKLTGTLPSELGNLKKMEIFFASQNQFTGTLPTEIGNWKELFYVRFNENQFSGTLPTELGIFTKMIWLNLFSNKFSGTLPSVLQNLTSLEEFSIFSNQLTGTLPSWIGNFKNLSILHVSANQFTGTLPSELVHLTKLKRFGVDLNKFTGTVPSWIGDLRNLTTLWLDGNQFTGTFPSEIGNNLDLKDFCIRNNNFTGSIPAEIQTDADCAFKV
ncbi:hypothetical protein HJC23_002138 [Cyclotella cryptica]|uniref:Disease resistance R13L4/SHOC-2-like LRR domain-containing protein n=1 Tax=Cyclotella cryptica TaxID=29204 RepID=A0ABD3Q2K6_9STRA|eukprot:CCRYP_009699-RA/>CCRYP_009699-RA protein AED:0.02 eAED:0.02 QI:95/1/1/1/1/1/2/153/942